jgi:hypothetical protein
LRSENNRLQTTNFVLNKKSRFTCLNQNVQMEKLTTHPASVETSDADIISRPSLAVCVLGGLLYDDIPTSPVQQLYQAASADKDCDVIVVDPNEPNLPTDVMSKWPDIAIRNEYASIFDFDALFEQYAFRGGVCIVNDMRGRDVEKYDTLWRTTAVLIEDALKRNPRCSVCAFTPFKHHVFVQTWPTTVPQKGGGFATLTNLAHVHFYLGSFSKLNLVHPMDLLSGARALNKSSEALSAAVAGGAKEK